MKMDDAAPLMMGGLVAGLMMLWMLATFEATRHVESLENEAIEHGYAHITARDGQRKFEWIEREDLRKRLKEGWQ